MRPLVAPFASLVHHPLAWVFLIALQVLTYQVDWPTFHGAHLEAWVLALVTLRVHRELTRPRPFRRPEDVAGGVLLRLPLFVAAAGVGGASGGIGFFFLIYGFVFLTPLAALGLLVWAGRALWSGRCGEWRGAAWALVLGTPLVTNCVVLGFLAVLAPAAAAYADEGWGEAWWRFRHAAANPFRFLAILGVAFLTVAALPNGRVEELVAANYVLAATAALLEEAPHPLRGVS
jgi:hypothetical protein